MDVPRACLPTRWLQSGRGTRKLMVFKHSGRTMSHDLRNVLGKDRITSRQVDELIGLARGLVADNRVDQSEVEYLQSWLAANLAVSDEPMIRILYDRIAEVLSDGVVDADEHAELLVSLRGLTGGPTEIGEVLKSTTIPFCKPAPKLRFEGVRYCFTGTFTFGQRKHCERAVIERGAEAGSLTKKTNVLVVGVYATESWKHSSFGNKIKSATDWRSSGHPISIVSEVHWTEHL